jgi:hypothetical protein
MAAGMRALLLARGRRAPLPDLGPRERRIAARSGEGGGAGLRDLTPLPALVSAAPLRGAGSR